MTHLFKCLPFTLLAALASCSDSASNGSESQDMIDLAIEKAEKAIPMDDSNLFGPVVSLSQRNDASVDTLKNMLKTRVRALVQEEQSTEDATRKNEIKNEIRSYFEKGDSLIQVLRQRNEETLQKATQDLIGKPLPAEADSKFFSKAEAHIAEIKSGSDVVIAFKATTSATLPNKFHLVFADSNHNPLITSYPVWCSPQSAGSTFEGTTSMHISVVVQTQHLIFTQ